MVRSWCTLSSKSSICRRFWQLFIPNFTVVTHRMTSNKLLSGSSAKQHNSRTFAQLMAYESKRNVVIGRHAYTYDVANGILAVAMESDWLLLQCGILTCSAEGILCPATGQKSMLFM